MLAEGERYRERVCLSLEEQQDNDRRGVSAPMQKANRTWELTQPCMSVSVFLFTALCTKAYLEWNWGSG